MKRALNNKEVKELIERVSSIKLEKKARYDIDGDIIFMDGEPILFYIEGAHIPTLKLLQREIVLKRITVDMGAVPFVIKGADIMRPGIREIEEGIAKDELVAVVDEKHGKALAVGKALFGYLEMRAMSSGKVIKNIHYIGDRVWNAV